MVIETYYAGGYWGARQESLDLCTERVAALLAALGQCDLCLARWFMQGETREEALTREVTSDTASLRELLAQSRDAYDAEHGLGYSLGLWNGGDEGAELSLSLYCGSENIWVTNVCLLNFGLYHSAAFERLLQVPMLTAVVRCLVSAWNPDCGVVRSSSQLIGNEVERRFIPHIGWLTYLSPDRGPLPPLPSSARVVPLGDAGSLIIATDERFTASNATHIATTEQIRAALAGAGMLAPLGAG